jgi:hypothetical protein
MRDHAPAQCEVAPAFATVGVLAARPALATVGVLAARPALALTTVGVLAVRAGVALATVGVLLAVRQQRVGGAGVEPGGAGVALRRVGL